MFQVAVRHPMPIRRQGRITRFSKAKRYVLVALVGQVDLRRPVALYAGNHKVALRDKARVVNIDGRGCKCSLLCLTGLERLGTISRPRP